MRCMRHAVKTNPVRSAVLIQLTSVTNRRTDATAVAYTRDSMQEKATYLSFITHATTT